MPASASFFQHALHISESFNFCNWNFGRTMYAYVQLGWRKRQLVGKYARAAPVLASKLALYESGFTDK